MRNTTTKASPPKKKPLHLLVVAAWGPELDGIRAALPTLCRGLNLRTTLAEVGVGLVSAAIGTSRAIATHSPDAVVLLGTAGALPARTHSLPIGQAVWVGKASLPADLSGGKHAYFPGLVQADQNADPPSFLGLPAPVTPLAHVICPLGITRSARAARTLAVSSGASLENLEAFSVLAAAKAAQRPCMIILGIANRVGPEGHAQWKKHGKAAAQAASSLLLAALKARG